MRNKLILLLFLVLTCTAHSQTLLPNPISPDQLRLLQHATRIDEYTRLMTREALDQRRKALPTWYPIGVWNEIVDNILKLDLVEAELPIYQQGVDSDTADLVILLYQGPTGEKLAQKMLEGKIAAAHAGKPGARVLDGPIQPTDQSTLAVLWRQRYSELDSTQAAKALDAATRFNAFATATDREISALYDTRAHEVMNEVQLRHKKEIDAAYHAAASKP